MFTLLPRRTPKPEPLVLEEVREREELIEQHVAVAQKLGVRTWHEPKYSLPKVLIELGITVYDSAKVERYMDSKGYWGWFPLRKEDKVSPPYEDRTIERVTPHRHPTLYGGTKREQYDKIVPLPALLRAEQIVEKLPSARFFIAAVDNRPDPFLGVLDGDDQNNRIYIIERWDEPGFRG